MKYRWSRVHTKHPDVVVTQLIAWRPSEFPIEHCCGWFTDIAGRVGEINILPTLGKPPFNVETIALDTVTELGIAKLLVLEQLRSCGIDCDEEITRLP